MLSEGLGECCKGVIVTQLSNTLSGLKGQDDYINIKDTMMLWEGLKLSRRKGENDSEDTGLKDRERKRVGGSWKEL